MSDYEMSNPQPGEVYEDWSGGLWTVVGVHNTPTVIMQDGNGERKFGAIGASMWRGWRRWERKASEAGTSAGEHLGSENSKSS